MTKTGRKKLAAKNSRLFVGTVGFSEVIGIENALLILLQPNLAERRVSNFLISNLLSQKQFNINTIYYQILTVPLRLNLKML